MGQGYDYKCKKCKHEYSVYPGIGMRYPNAFRELLQKIEDGGYGEEWKQLLKDTPYAAANAERIVYICKKCGQWEIGQDITLYAPNNPKTIPGKQYGTKTVKDWGYVPYVMGWELKEEYHVLKRHYHKCNKCGQRMHKASEEEMQHLTCPKCGTENEVEGLIMWD